jgi:prepilin-type N-terminal cleavage/methylation domain-containing protein
MKQNNSGFSMIEVLVAATILTMIVMMLGMIFQQTSLAWRTGRHRANTYEQVRALFGAIQRDASAAVDAKTLPAEITSTGSQGFSGSSLSFFTLTGSCEKEKPYRAITHVSYNGVGRTVTRFTPGMNPEPQTGTIVDQSVDGVTLDAIEAVAVGDGTFPDYVTLKVKVKKGARMQNYDVGAASGGPDMTMGKGDGDIRGRDDIKTWVEQ